MHLSQQRTPLGNSWKSEQLLLLVTMFLTDVLLESWILGGIAGFRVNQKVPIQ